MLKKKAQNDFISRLISSPENRLSTFKVIPTNKQGFILLGLSKHIREEIIHKLTNQELLQLIVYLDPDETTDLLQKIDSSRRKDILQKLSAEVKGKVEYLLRFNPRTAAGIMSLNYIQAEKNITFGSLSKLIRKHESRTGKVPSILVVEDGFLIGKLPTHTLAIAKKSEKILKYVRKIPHIKYDQDEGDIVNVFKKNPHNKIVVLDKDNSIMGVIYSDDVLRLTEHNPSEELSDFAGVGEEDVFDSMAVKVKSRYKWLIINLATAFLAAYVVSLFEPTIAAFTLLAVYMPIVAGMGGNAATQTLAVVVRGLALKEIELKTARKVIINEMAAGAINGIINGIIVAIVAVLWNKSPLLGFVTAVAMVVNLIVAGFFGALIPLIMKRLGKDPAASATIFITTATDVFGFLTFLGLATIMLR